MKREREMKRERDELDLLAAEAGQSALLVGMTALILVIALVLGFARLTSDRRATWSSMVVNDGRLLTGGVWGAILGVVIGYLLSTVLTVAPDDS